VSGWIREQETHVLSNTRSRPIRYTRELTAAEARARTSDDIKKDVTRTFVNAGRLLRGLVDPRVKLAWRRSGTSPKPRREDGVKWLYWQPSRHQVRMDSRVHRHYEDYQDAREQEHLWTSRQPSLGDSLREELDQPHLAAQALLGVTGTDKKGYHKVALEMHAQDVIQEHIENGAIGPDQYAKLEQVQAETLKQTRGKLREERSALRRDMGRIGREQAELTNQLESAPETVETLEPRKEEALGTKAKLEPQRQKALEQKASQLAKLKAELEETLLPKLAPGRRKELKEQLRKHAEAQPKKLAEMMKSEAEREATKLEKQVATLKDELASLLKAKPSALNFQEASALELREPQPELIEALAALESDLQPANEVLGKLESAKDILRHGKARLAGMQDELDAVHERLGEIDLEMQMRTAFVSLSARDRMVTLDLDLDSQIKLLGAIGERWIASKLTDDVFVPTPGQAAGASRFLLDGAAVLEDLQEEDAIQFQRFDPPNLE
jgi:DNA repair exonuclease SbcCD ATPase subunit